MSVVKPSFIYINGYPGVGKLTVACELRELIKNAKLFDNHSLIDATSMVYDRDMPEYQSLRGAMRRVVLDSIAASSSTKDIVWIFTDQQSSSKNGTLAVKDYQRAAAERGSPFVSIVLQCDLNENLSRLAGSGRGRDNTKLTSIGILRHIRATEDIYHMGGDLELEIDTTDMSSSQVAANIMDFLGTRGLTSVKL